jgi:hypothetical protein
MARQLELAHSAYLVDISDETGTLGHIFTGLARVSPDGKSGLYFFNLMWRDSGIVAGGHWSETASKEKLYEAAIERTKTVPPKYKEVIEKTTAKGMRAPPTKFHSLIMTSLPEGRVTLLGDAAHSMTPCEYLSYVITSPGILTRSISSR